jgi:hypothetical protein
MLQSVTCIQHHQHKVVDIVDLRTRQRVVTDSLTAKRSSPVEIHKCLRIMYGKNVIDVSSV